MRLIKKLKKQGFSVERTGSGHWKVTRPGREGRVIMAFSPSGASNYQEVKRLKELGYRP
jgi:predicted RNA binding protein YcfA (HicA-like mRNA interferase family)